MAILDVPTFAVVAGPWHLASVTPAPFNFLTWSRDGARLAIRNGAADVTIIDIPSGRSTVVPSPALPLGIGNVDFSADGTRLAIADNFAGVRLVDLRTNATIAQHYEHAWWFVNFVTFSPDGSRLAVGPFGGVETVLDGSTLAPVAACQAAPGSAAWSHDGTEFAVKEETGDLVVLDPATCARRETLSGSHAAGGVAFSPDGKRLASRGPDGTRIWDVATGAEIGTALPDTGDLLPTTYGFAADGRLMSTAVSATSSTVLFDLDPDHWLTTACAMVGRNLTQDEWTRYIGTLDAYRNTCPLYPAGP